MLLVGLSIGTTFLISAWLTRGLIAPPSALWVLDHPNRRSLHELPRQRTGGLAILSSFLVGALLSTWVGQSAWAGEGLVAATSGLVSWESLALGVAVLLVATVSFWDDRWGVPPLLRLAVQVVATVSVLVTGLGLNDVPVPMVGTLSLGVFALPVTLLFVLWMSNLFNFMDGMDGLAAGMAVFGFVCLGMIVFAHGSLELALLCGLLAAASGGFLVSNLPPALLFMGDVGSVSLGFLVAVLALRAIQQGACDIWVPVLVFSPFIVDTTVVLARRLLRGARLWEAHREHAYQRLVLSGWSHQRTLRAEYCLMMASGVAAVIYASAAGELARVVVLVTVALGYAALLVGVSRVEVVRHGRKMHGQV